MSPLALRRYRAERLLRTEFASLRGRVLAAVRGRLRASGVQLDAGDLEACYAQAWQGLYAAMVDGQEIANPTGWLTLVTYRRAIEESRASRRVTVGVNDDDPEAGTCTERDVAAELDDRTALRHLFEALRGRLNARELQAATLCYLQGFSRAEAAARMGISEQRMRKLMEGHGHGSLGVAGKVGELAATIRAGGWCEQQASLMRGFAFGILDPQGERYRLAMLHHGECPACRSYVLSLRGLAAVLPPAPCLLHLAVGCGLVSGGARAATAAGSGAHGGATPAGSGMSGGTLAAGTGAAGAGAAGGGWLLAGGPLGAKLAVGCLLALGVGAGCVALTDHPGRGHGRVHRRVPAQSASRGERWSAALAQGAGAADALSAGDTSGTRDTSAGAGAAAAASRASREFGPEQRSPARAQRSSVRVSTASSPRELSSARAASAASQASSQAPPAAATTTAGDSGGPSAAQREFAPG